MAHQRCLAQDLLDSGGYAVCSLWADAHGPEHKDGAHHWPACSQYCMREHAHGRYRLHIGQNLGPGSVEKRGPKETKPSRKRVACSVCLHRGGELEGGKCKDKAACRGRAPQLDLGLET